MRIVVANHHRGIVGGIETYLQSLLPALRCRGHEIALLYEQAAAGSAAVDGDESAGPAWWANGKAPAEVMREIEAWRPDVIYSHGLDDAGFEQAFLDAFPTVLYAHGYIGTCISGMKRFAFPHTQPCDRVFGAACLALYYPRRCGGLNPVTMVQHYRLQRSRRRLLERYSSILVASGHMREEYVRNGVPAEKVHLVPYFPPGTTPDAEAPGERVLDGRLLFVGRLTALKGCANLVMAASDAGRILNRQLHLTIAGAGSEQVRIEQLARTVGQSFDFRGWVSSEERTALMRSADILVVPSLWPEPFGLVGVEAGCVGLPAVAYDVGGVRDWLRPGESGELAPGHPPTVAGLTQALVRASADPQHRNRLARGAWNVAQQFSLACHCSLLEERLRRVAGTDPVAGGSSPKCSSAAT